VKGLQALENEIRSARRRLIKLRDAGRLSSNTAALITIRDLGELLDNALVEAISLRVFEVGRNVNQDNIPTK